MLRPFITALPSNFRVTTVDWDIDWREQSSGVTVTGRRNIDVNRLPRWVGRPTLEFFRSDIGIWRAHRLAARGMTGIFRIPMYDAAVYAAPCSDGVPFSDSATFSDGSGFSDDQSVRCDAGAARGATSIVVNMATASGSIRQGQIMSYADWPFCVTAIDGNTLHIEMPLRVDIPPGDLIRLQGRGLFEMVEARTGNPAYDTSLVSRPPLVLQEWLR